MKYYLMVSFLLLLFPLLQGCNATNKVAYNALITNVADDNLNSGLIHLKSTGRGEKEEDSIADAERNAFHAILFTGIPGSRQDRPIIADEKAAMAAHAVFFQDFFDQQGYRKFITAISNSGFKKDDGKKITTVDITVNMEALRRNLESNNITRKLGL